MTAGPDPTEYDPNFSKDIELVPNGDIVTILKSRIANTLAFLRNVSEENAGESYAPGKWSIKEVVDHIIATERIFAYRALRLCPNVSTPLAGLDQDDYVAAR